MESERIESSEKKEVTGSEPRKGRKRRFLRILGLVLILAGIAVVAYPLSTFLVTKKAQSGLRSDWSKIVKEATKNINANSTTANSTQTADDGKQLSGIKKIPTGQAAFSLIIPKIGLDMIVVEGTDQASLKQGPGHMSKTVLPNEPGVCVISGHRTTYGAPFFRLDRLQNGDEIIVEMPTTRLVYKVFDIKSVDPNDTSFIVKTDQFILALTTCTPIHSARQRLVVLARL